MSVQTVTDFTQNLTANTQKCNGGVQRLKMIRRIAVRNDLWRKINYKPHAKQRGIHDAISLGAKRLIAMWGRRSGKSIMSATELVTEGAESPDGALPYRIIRVTGPETDVTDKIFGYIWKWCVDDKLYSMSPSRQSAQRRYIEFPWGVRFEGKTTFEPKSLLGDGIVITAVDEHAGDKPNILMRYVLPPLLDTDGIALITGTPDGLRNHFYLTYKQWLERMQGGDSRYYASHATSYDNRAITDYERFCAQLDDERREYARAGAQELFEQEYMAKATSLSGAIYPMFTEARHVRSLVPIAGVPLTLGIDWGFHNPFVCLFAQVLNDGERIHILDEIYQAGMTDDECANAVLRKAEELGLPIEFSYADPSSPEAIRAFQERGIPMYTGSQKINAVNDGIYRVRSFMGSDNLAIDPRCKNLIEENMSYAVNDRAIDEKPLKIADHACDAERYLISGIVLATVKMPLWI